jgi:hypothetical protein
MSMIGTLLHVTWNESSSKKGGFRKYAGLGLRYWDYLNLHGKRRKRCGMKVYSSAELTRHQILIF